MAKVPEIVLLGDPVEHSKSPVFQNAGLQALGSPLRFGLRRVDELGLSGAVEEIRAGTLIGANVTAPHKAAAFSRMDGVTEQAAATGSVNTIWRDSGGRVQGDNTDVQGVIATLEAMGFSGREPGTVVVFGAGGAAAAAVLACGERFSEVVIVNRTLARAQALCVALASWSDARLVAMAWDSGVSVALARAQVVVNATSLEFAAEAVAREAWEAVGLAGCKALAWLDLSYAPQTTRFLAWAPEELAQAGRARDGATMLLHQGVAALVRWTGGPAPLEVMRAALAEALGRPSSAV